ncbi:YlbD family protein [Niallia sp.]|uniref:YlbD family protein n=1 Tax=Niallia sp. TaxID=2837523 RepID=UPI0028A083B5|nr:YlbD family protein [Niallia sp.]
MANNKLHPSVEEFKAFIKTNPKILKEARSGKVTLQELYEDWYLLGPNDARWDGLLENGSKASEQKEEEKASYRTVWLSNIADTLKNMDQNQIQGYLANLNQALGTIQGVISQFAPNSGSGGSSAPTEQKPSGPFSFRKD